MKSVKTKHIVWSLRLLAFIIFYTGFLCNVRANTNPWLLQEVMIASKVDFPGDCIDIYGVTRGHLENWTSAEGSCDRRMCYMGALETIKWQINYDCPDQLENLLDNGNCFYQSDTELDFPFCCPYLVCNNATIETTTVPACYDESPTVTCEFWRNLTDCAPDPNSLNPLLYNLTVEFCRLTCGFC
ncbi:hypothetical protein ACF0H5_005212 [Mactra antiquata]